MSFFFLAAPPGIASQALLALGLVAPPQGVPVPPPSDPFAPGLRWSQAAETIAPWIPRDACFVQGGELIWAAPAGPNPALRLLSTAEIGSPTTLFADSALTGALGELRVAAGDSAAELFAAAQFPAPTSATRQTLITRHDALAAAQAAPGAPFLPSWTHDMGLRGNGPARLAATPDGACLVAAAFDATTQSVQVDRLDPVSGALLARAQLPASGLSSLALASDGSLAALAAGTRLWVLDDTATVVWERALSTGIGALDLSADGTVLAYGTASRVEVLALDSGGYASSFVRSGAVSEVAVGIALDDDGSTLAVSWWDFSTGADVRIELVDTLTHGLVNAYAQSGGGGLQNFPSALGLAADGSRLAVGLWGVGDARPEVVLLDRSDPVPLFQADVPGSVYALAIDSTATRVVVGLKDAHANLFSASGELRLYDTGERDLQLTAAPRPGESVDLALRMPEDGLALFAAGFALDRPVLFKGQPLWIDWNGPHFVFFGAVGALRANLSIGIAPDASLVGLPLAVQAATLGASGVTLSSTLVRPSVL